MIVTNTYFIGMVLCDNGVLRYVTLPITKILYDDNCDIKKILMFVWTYAID